MNCLSQAESNSVETTPDLDGPCRQVIIQFVHQLYRGLGHEFSIFDLADGELVSESGHQPSGDSAWRMSQVENWEDPSQVHLQKIGGPLVCVLLPLPRLDERRFAALGVFRTGDNIMGRDLTELAAANSANAIQLREWTREQPVWSCEVLRRLGEFVSEKIAADHENSRLKHELDGLSENMGEVFEQLSLLYGTTENLRGSNSATELFAVLQDWLADILPAEQVIMEIHGNHQAIRNGESTYLSYGDAILDRAGFKDFIEYLQPRDPEIPMVVNEETTSQDGWPFPRIRELIVVPLRTDERNTGWMAALNHAAKGWFGTTQARLLHAVATLLGMRVLFEEVVRLRETSEAASTAKSIFLTNVSHEFRTPLNGIMNLTRVLLDDPSGHEPDILENLQTIDSCAQRLLEMVEDVVEFSKIDTRRRETNKVPCLLDEFVQCVVSELRVRAYSKRLLLESICENESEIVYVEPLRLRQVLSILVRNAIKFTDAGAVTVRSRIIESPSRRLRIAVEDTGVGIAPEKLDSIFDPFVMGDESLTRRHGGLGLGLSIGRRIIRSLGGDLSVKSEPSQGSTFTLDIDAGQPPEYQAAQNSSETELEDSRKEPLASPAWSPPSQSL